MVMINKTDKKLLLILIIIVVLVAAPFIVAFSYFFGPVDTFPRLYKTAQCSDSSWSSVGVYRKKAYWFLMDTDILVKVSDDQGNIVYEEKLFQFDTWGGVASTMHGDAPRGFCNKALFVHKK